MNCLQMHQTNRTQNNRFRCAILRFKGVPCLNAGCKSPRLTGALNQVATERRMAFDFPILPTPDHQPRSTRNPQGPTMFSGK